MKYHVATEELYSDGLGTESTTTGFDFTTTSSKPEVVALFRAADNNKRNKHRKGTIDKLNGQIVWAPNNSLKILTLEDEQGNITRINEPSNPPYHKTYFAALKKSEK